jgi:lysophospholipase L1-like esterase
MNLKKFLPVSRHFKLNTAVLCCGLPLLACAADEPKVIAFVGDSITVGVGASNPARRYSTLAVEMLNKEAGKTLYKELNLAVSGSSMTTHPWPRENTSGYPFIIDKVVEAKPDIVVINHGVNDNGGGMSLAQYAWCYRNLVREIKAKLPKAKIICMTITPMRAENKTNSEWTNQANAVIQEIAALENTMAAHANLEIRNRMEFFPDGTHPNDQGYQAIAEALVKAIKANRIQSVNDFDFVVQKAGTYRLCGYTFIVSPAAAKNNSYTCFYNVTNKGWSYVSNGAVNVLSDPLRYPVKMECKLSNNAAVRSSYRAYFKEYAWYLPGTEGKLVKAELVKAKQLKKK